MPNLRKGAWIGVCGLLALLLVCLFRPVLVVRAAVPQQNVVGLLLDD